jgi:hypothetical protein
MRGLLRFSRALFAFYQNKIANAYPVFSQMVSVRQKVLISRHFRRVPFLP